MAFAPCRFEWQVGRDGRFVGCQLMPRSHLSEAQRSVPGSKTPSSAGTGLIQRWHFYAQRRNEKAFVAAHDGERLLGCKRQGPEWKRVVVGDLARTRCGLAVLGDFHPVRVSFAFCL